MIRSILMKAALLAALAAPAVAQEVTDTIRVEIVGEPAALVIDGPSRAYVGDTITFSYRVVDEAGEDALGVVSFSVTDPALAEIVEETDSTLVVHLRARGSLTIIANVQRVSGLAIGGTYRENTGDLEGSFQWAFQGPFAVRWSPASGLNPRIELCAAAYTDSRVVFTTARACAEAVDQYLRTQNLPAPLQVVQVPARTFRGLGLTAGA